MRCFPFSYIVLEPVLKRISVLISNLFAKKLQNSLSIREILSFVSCVSGFSLFVFKISIGNLASCEFKSAACFFGETKQQKRRNSMISNLFVDFLNPANYISVTYKAGTEGPTLWLGLDVWALLVPVLNSAEPVNVSKPIDGIISFAFKIATHSVHTF